VAKLQDAVPPERCAAIQEILTNELGREPKEVFANKE